MCEKPMECSKCKRTGEVYYTEMKDGKSTKTVMCKSCPLLKSKLYLANVEENSPSVFSPSKEKCSVCGLTSEEFLITLTLGCEACATAFADILEKEITSQGLIPSGLKNRTHLDSYHFGSVPKGKAGAGFSKKIESLQIALNEAIEAEQFEDAADIRDQIQKCMENPNASST